MSVSVCTPDTTINNSGTVTGLGGDADAVLADGSTATYIDLDPGEGVKVGFGSPTPAVAAGAVRKSLQAYVYAAAPGGGGDFPSYADTTLWYSAAAFTTRRAVVNWTGQKSWSAAKLDGSYSDTNVWINVGVPSAYAYLAPLRLYALQLWIEWVAKPVTVPTAPDNDTRPTIGWENTLDSAGGPQTAFQTRIFTSAQYGIGGFNPETSPNTDSGWGWGSATTWQGTAGLADGTYRAYVRVCQSVNGASHWSDWAYDQFTVSVSRPGVPTMTATAQPTASPVGRVQLVIDDSAGAATTDEIQVQRKDGSDWVDIRTLLGDGRVGGSWASAQTIYDYEAPTDGTVATYRARAIHDASGLDVYSDWTADKTATLTPTSWSLIHPADPSKSRNVELRSFAGYGREARQTVLQALGRPDAVVVSDTMAPESGTVVIRASDDATRDAIEALVADGVTLLLRAHPSHHERSRWVAVSSAQTERLVDNAWIIERNVTLEWTEVASPSGNLAAWS